jgi:hypothetical protein
VLRSRLLLAATVALAVAQTFSYTFASLLRTPILHSLSACALLLATILVTIQRYILAGEYASEASTERSAENVESIQTSVSSVRSARMP